MKQYLTQVQHRGHTCAVLLYVSLQLLKIQSTCADVTPCLYNVYAVFVCIKSSLSYVQHYLLQVQFSLDLLKVTGIIDNRARELCLNVCQPGT